MNDLIQHVVKQSILIKLEEDIALDWELFILTDQTGKGEQDVFLVCSCVLKEFSSENSSFSLSLFCEVADARSLR